MHEFARHDGHRRGDIARLRAQARAGQGFVRRVAGVGLGVDDERRQRNRLVAGLGGVGPLLSAKRKGIE